jgi:hypothetical protein
LYWILNTKCAKKSWVCVPAKNLEMLSDFLSERCGLLWCGYMSGSTMELARDVGAVTPQLLHNNQHHSAFWDSLTRFLTIGFFHQSIPLR